MPDPMNSLTGVQRQLSDIQSFLKTFDDDLDECSSFSFFRSWPQRVSRVTECVRSLSEQVGHLTTSVESICRVLKGEEPKRPTQP